jgi:beta-glucosidase
MLPDSIEAFTTKMDSLVKSADIPLSRIDDAVRRILIIKFQMGLFEKPLVNKNQLDKIGSAVNRAVARECVRKSIVLLKNENRALPLSKTTQRIYVFGSKANDLGSQCGGWTISWQGGTGTPTTGTTISQAIKKVNTVSATSSNADIGVFVFGESPYAEMFGDKEDLTISDADLQQLIDFKKTGKPVVAILISGRPMIINNLVPYCDAFIAAWLPGTEGDGVADVLFGDFMPSGKLSFSWPVSMSQIPINEGDQIYEPLLPIFSGMTSFSGSILSSYDVEYSNDMYPNPATDHLIFSNKLGYKVDTVFGVSGNRVSSPTVVEVSNGLLVDMSNYENGIYTIVLRSPFGEKSYHRIVKK